MSLFLLIKVFGQFGDIFVPFFGVFSLQLVYFFFDVGNMAIDIFERFSLQFAFTRFLLRPRLAFGARSLGILQIVFGLTSLSKKIQEWIFWKKRTPLNGYVIFCQYFREKAVALTGIHFRHGVFIHFCWFVFAKCAHWILK